MSYHEGVWYGDHSFTLPVHMNYGRYFLEEILKFKDKIALIDGVTGEQITYGQMAQQILNVAGYLQRMDVRVGEVIAICSENRIEYIITTIAAVYIGAVVSFINSAYTRGEIFHVINVSKPRYVFLSPAAFDKHFDSFASTIISRKFFIFGESPNKFKALSFKDLTKEFTDIQSVRYANFYGQKAIAYILMSSGTTGLPKGAKLTHLNLITAALQEQPCPRDLRILSVAPWCNCMGIITLTDALVVGKTFIFIARFNEKLFLETIQKYKAGYLVLAPPVVISLCKSTILDNYDVSSVETIMSGGAPLDADAQIRAKERLPNLRHILQGYGMSETSGALTIATESASKDGSTGKVLLGIIIKVVDIKNGRTLGPNQRGEVCVKGAALFDGYVGKESELDEEGFYKTGDIAYYDEEGYFFIVDRLKELIKYKAWQVAPSELEAVILQHPAIKDAGVVGIPDKEAGEIPFAFAVKKGKVSEKELMDFVASKVSPWKRIRGGVKFVDEIPKNGSGKILRRELREMLKSVPTSKL